MVDSNIIISGMKIDRRKVFTLDRASIRKLREFEDFLENPVRYLIKDTKKKMDESVTRIVTNNTRKLYTRAEGKSFLQSMQITAINQFRIDIDFQVPWAKYLEVGHRAYAKKRWMVFRGYYPNAHLVEKTLRSAGMSNASAKAASTSFQNEAKEALDTKQRLNISAWRERKMRERVLRQRNIQLNERTSINVGMPFMYRGLLRTLNTKHIQYIPKKGILPAKPKETGRYAKGTYKFGWYTVFTKRIKAMEPKKILSKIREEAAKIALYNAKSVVTRIDRKIALIKSGNI